MRTTDHPLKVRGLLGWCRLIFQLSLIIVMALVLFTRPMILDAVRAEEISMSWLLIGPFTFLLLFLVCLILEFLYKRKLYFTAPDFIKILFGILVILLLFPSSFREYRLRRISNPMSLSLIEQFFKHKDAGVRALAVLASSRHKIHDPMLGALIHKALLDKDPLVQQAAKLIIEDNFGIRLKNGVEGIHQAQALLTEVSQAASLIQKGSP